MFHYNIDELFYIPDNRIIIKGWAIGSKELRLSINGDEKIIHNNIKRVDVLEHFNKLVFKEKHNILNTDILGFEYIYDIDESLNDISLDLYSNDRREKNIFKYSKEELLKLKDKNSILYNIDAVDEVRDRIIIKGWALSKYEDEIKIELNNCANYNILKCKRFDVVRAYQDYNPKIKCGFEIFLKKESFFNEIKINISDTLNTLCHTIKISDINQLIDANLKNNFISNYDKMYDVWREKNKITSETINYQKKYKFNYSPMISILVCINSESEKYFTQMINSILNQTYLNWEVCIANTYNCKSLKQIYDNDKFKIINLSSQNSISEQANIVSKLAKGDYICVLEPTDLLTEDALFEIVKNINYNKPDIIYTDHDNIDESDLKFLSPCFKPDWSPDTFRSYNYIKSFTVFKRELFNKVGKYNCKFDEIKDYDLMLRLTEISDKIIHIPKILYHRRINRVSESLVDEKNKIAISEHLRRLELEGIVENGLFTEAYKVNYKIKENPKVSIIIPNKDHLDELKKCINSIILKSIYKNYEIIIVENNSTSQDIFNYYDELQLKYKNIKVLKWNNKFNFSAINNFAIKEASGDYLILLNNDVEIISNSWIEEMLMFAQRDDVGIVGAKLYYPDDTIQHAGIILGINGIAGHSHKNYPKDSMGYCGRCNVVQNISAVTAACLMTRKKVFEEVDGFDENFEVAFNDVDFCLKVREKGYLVIFTPYSQMYHYESKSRGYEDTEEKRERFEGEVTLFEKKWGMYLEDPYYNINLTLNSEDFSIR